MSMTALQYCGRKLACTQGRCSESSTAMLPAPSRNYFAPEHCQLPQRSTSALRYAGALPQQSKPRGASRLRGVQNGNGGDSAGAGQPQQRPAAGDKDLLAEGIGDDDSGDEREGAGASGTAAGIPILPPPTLTAADEQRRMRLLAPYLYPAPKHGIIGSSKYADRLRKQVVAAARDDTRRPVLVLGPPGLEKSNIAALIHYGSPSGRTQPMAALDCARQDSSAVLASKLFGRGGKEGLLESVGAGTLLLKNVHKLSPGVLSKVLRLLSTGTYRRVRAAPAGARVTPLQSLDAPPEAQQQPLRASTCRLLLTASKPVPELGEEVLSIIKVPPLKVRPADVKDLQRYYLIQLQSRRGSLDDDEDDLTGGDAGSDLDEILATASAATAGGSSSSGDGAFSLGSLSGSSLFPGSSIMGSISPASSTSSPAGSSSSSPLSSSSGTGSGSGSSSIIEAGGMRVGYTSSSGRKAAKTSVTVTPAALKELQNYSWPGNVKEVAQVVKRALLQAKEKAAAEELAATKVTAAAAAASKTGGAAGPAAAGSSSKDATLCVDDFWYAKSDKDRYRVNLLSGNPGLLAVLKSDVWPDRINWGFTVYTFPVIVAMLMWGPQDRLHNPSLAIFWDYWWPLVFLSFPFLGRVWCAVCPFMITGELVQKWRTSGGAKLLKWPKEEAEKYGPVFLFSLFAAILVWEEVWDLPHTAYLSGWLLLLITAGAVICSSIFERRFWCRYLCPIGGMNGLFAKLSATEVRGRQGVCAGECKTYNCFKGGPAPMAGGGGEAVLEGCPLYTHPAQLVDNHDCINCMKCIKACPNGSVEVRLRPPGADLWSGHTASVAEVSLMFMLQGAVFVHLLPELAAQVGVGAEAAGLTSVTPQHIAASVVLLALPGLGAWAADALGRKAMQLQLQPQPPQAAPAGTKAVANAAAPFVELAYGYLPLVWASTLAYYMPSLLEEGRHILPITAAMFGHESWLAALDAADINHEVVGFIQGALLLGGLGASAALSRQLAAGGGGGGGGWRGYAPQLAVLGAVTAELWALMTWPF